jgi:hypothetical protein
MTTRKVTIRYPAESIGDIPPADYADAVEALIAGHFGGEYEYDIAPASVARTQVALAGDWGDGPEEEGMDPDESAAVRRVHEICGEAFERCCAGDLPAAD